MPEQALKQYSIPKSVFLPVAFSRFSFFQRSKIKMEDPYSGI